MSGPPFEFTPITGRPRIVWPGGARVAVHVAVNVEHWPYGQPGISIVPNTAALPVDPANHGWRDYGNRVGFFRLAELLDRVGVPVTGLLQTDVIDHYPGVVEEGVRRGWRWAAHGRNSGVLQTFEDAESERADLAGQVARIEAATGARPRGWLGPALTETERTPALLAELGFDHVLDWCNDDQPYRLDVDGMVSVPYSLEVNDIPLFVTKGVSGPEYQQVLVDQFDALYEVGRESGVVMAVPLHTFLVGLPFRLRYLRAALEHIAGHEGVWLTTSDEIARYYLEHH